MYKAVTPSWVTQISGIWVESETPSASSNVSKGVGGILGVSKLNHFTSEWIRIY